MVDNSVDIFVIRLVGIKLLELLAFSDEIPINTTIIVIIIVIRNDGISLIRFLDYIILFYNE